MKKLITYASALPVLAIILLLSPLSQIQAQTNLGLRIDFQTDSLHTQEVQNLIAELNISWVEIMGNPEPKLLTWAADQDVEVYLHSGLEFLTAHRLANPEELNFLVSWITSNEVKPDVSGFSILMRSSTFKPSVEGILGLYADSLSQVTSKKLIIHSYLSSSEHPAYSYLDDVIYEFRDAENADVLKKRLYFDRPNYKPSDIAILNRVLPSAPELLVLHLDWIIQAIQDNPDLKTALSILHEDSQLLPEPYPEDTPSKANWNLILLVFIWVTIITHYAYHPEYRNNLFRYFLSHAYFVKEIMEYRIRNTSNGFIILIQHSVIGGLFFYYLIRASFSNAGIQAFFDNLPLISFLGDTFLSVFIIGFFVVAIFQITAIIWISIFNREIKHLSQILTLYAWPLQINFLIVTWMSTLFQTSEIGKTFYVLAVLFVFIWFNAFNLAAIDTARFKRSGRILYAFNTVVLHVLLTAGTILFILYFTPFYQALELSLHLP